MCGISGIYRRVGGMKQEERHWRNVLRAMNKAQKHRGPDEEGIYVSDNCGLAHVRLSILDLKMGTQPMYYNTGAEKYAIVYNGEIYNMHEIREEKTVEKVAFLIRDAIRMQLLSDIPVCTFLSGGLDSSIVTSVASECMKEKGMKLSTYSFDFEGNAQMKYLVAIHGFIVRICLNAMHFHGAMT